MAKYDLLGNYLGTQPPSTTSVILTFAEIDKVIALNALPNGARQYFSFWACYGEGTGISKAYSNAGFKIVMIDLENEQVKFKRI